MLVPSGKPILRTRLWNLAKFVKIFAGIIAHQRRTPPQTNGIADRALRTVKESTSSIVLQFCLCENGGLIPWNVIVLCEKFKTSQPPGERFGNGVLENHVVGPRFFSGR